MNKAADKVKKEIFTRLGGRPIDPIELQDRLALKADRRQVDIIDDMKLDRVEVENYNQMIAEQNKHIIQIIAILIEYFKLTVPKGTIGENISSDRRGNLLKRTFTLFQSVNTKDEALRTLVEKRGSSSKTPPKYYTINKPRSLSDKKSPKKSVQTSTSKLIDLPIERTPNAFEARPLTSTN